MRQALVILFFISGIWIGSLSAQDEESAESSSWSELYELKGEGVADSQPQVSEGIPLSVEEIENLRNVRFAWQELEEAKYQHQVWRLKHIERAFDSHSRGTYAIFLVVVIIVMSGLVMSWMQFSAYSRAASAHPADATPKPAIPVPRPAPTIPVPESAPAIPVPGPAPTIPVPESAPAIPVPESAIPVEQSAPVNSLKINKSGVELSSPVLGLAILVFSLAFFFLYIVHVYPLHDTNGNVQRLPSGQGVQGSETSGVVK